MKEQHAILGAGPVGRAIAKCLTDEHDIKPTVITRSGTNVPGSLSASLDLSDAQAARQALSGADVVYQCAQPAYNRWPEEFPALQRSITEAIAGTDTVLVATENMYGYGPVSEALNEGLPLAATTRKGAVRAQLWNELERSHQAGEIRAVAARASDFYGPGVENSAYGSRFFGPLVVGKKAEVLGDPSTRHTVTYVPDLARAMVRLGGDSEAWGRAWHVPNAPAQTTEEMVVATAQLAGTSPATNRIGPLKMRLAGLFVPAAKEMIELSYEFDQDFVVDSHAYTERYGAEFTPLEEGLARTVRWYQDQAARA